MANSCFMNIIWLQMLVTVTAWTTSDLPTNKYMSYLQYPHISFRGRFKANVATGNNPYKNYDSENFFHYDVYSNQVGGKNQWNPEGTNDFYFIGCHVTSACHADGQCTDSSNKDSVCGQELTDGGYGSFAKIVDIDTAYQVVPEIWAWTLKVPGYFEGKMDPTPLTDYWARQGVAGDSKKGGSYQSVIKNIVWYEDVDKSTAVKQMKETMQKIGSDKLSIIFYLDLFTLSSSTADKDFATGRIIGTIGVSGPLAPTVSVWGRSLAPKNRCNPEKGCRNNTVYTYDSPFVIEKDQRRLYINFENGLSTLRNGNPKLFPPNTSVGYLKRNMTFNSTGHCLESVDIIGSISDLNLTDLFLNYGGIVSMDLTSKQITDLENNRLLIFQAKEPCTLYMKEHKDGILYLPYHNYVFRLEANQPIEMILFVMKFGKPLSNAEMVVVAFDKPFVIMGPRTQQRVAPRSFWSNEKGFVIMKLATVSSKHIRKGLDGNLEGYHYYVRWSKMSEDKPKSCTMIVAKVYHPRNYKEPYTWVDHVQPTFQQYANLYPVMRSRSFEMDSYFDVVAHKDIMKLSLTLPMSHPSYMPATRDLSIPRRNMILKWLSQEQPQFGDVSKLITKHYLLEMLQIALEITHVAVPSFLTALWSIKGKYNKHVSTLFNSIISLELHKMGIISTAILALGGKPKFVHKTFVPPYPSRLHGNIRKELIVTLEKLSYNLLREKFLQLKRPDIDATGLWFRNTVFKHTYLHKNTNSNKVKEKLNKLKEKYKKKCLLGVEAFLKHPEPQKEAKRQEQNAYIDPQDRHIFKYHSSINKFFNHILFVFSHLTNCGTNNKIFAVKNKMVPLPSNSSFGKIPVIHDYYSAVFAIRRLIQVTNHVGDGYKSQYSALLSIVDEKTSFPFIRDINLLPRKEQKEAHYLHKKFVKNMQQRPPKPAGIFEKGVWPILANAKVDNYPKGKIKRNAKAFNEVYTFFLKACETLFKRKTRKEVNHFSGIVTQLAKGIDILARQLVQLPIHKRGHKHVGPNVSPTFELSFERLSQTKFLFHKSILSQLEKENWNFDKYHQIKKRYVEKESNTFATGKTDGPVPQGNLKIDPSTYYADADEVVFEPLQQNPLVDVRAAYDDWSLKDNDEK